MLALLLVIVLAAILCLKLLPLFSGGYQAFTDFIIENVSQSGLNKSGELALFWLITAGGAILLCLLMLLFMKLIKKMPSFFQTAPFEDFVAKKHPICLFATIIPFISYLIIFKQLSLPLLFGSIISIICIFIPRLHPANVLFAYILSYYGLLAILSIACHFTTRAQYSSNVLYTITLFAGTLLVILSLIVPKYQKNSLFNQRIMAVIQCLLPGLYAIFLIDKYSYGDTIIRVAYAPGYYIFFTGLAMISFAVLIYHLIRYWNEKKEDIICAATPIIIFVYHSFCAAPMYAQPDQHHHGEQMIPFNQIFTHGQSLYDTYTPVSGLFPFVNGFIQHIFLGGTVTDYAPAISITMVIFCIITMYFIYKHVGGSYALMFAVLFTLPCYNRQYMVLPLLLLLTLPKLLEKPLSWFLCYIGGSFLAGLYYPLFGAAVLLGIFPIACLQMYQMIKEKPKLWTKKNIPAFIGFGILFILIIANVPLLLRILKHTLTYSSQTITADGITLSNQQAPEYFMPFLGTGSVLRHYLYISLRFLLPAISIWILVYFAVYALKEKEIKRVLVLLSGMITLMISYSYTLVRADTNKILSRTAPILIAIIGIFLPIILIKQYQNTEKEKSHIILRLNVIMGFCLSLPLILYMQVSHTKNPDLWVYPDGESQLVMDDDAKLFAYYTVPDTFLKSEDTGLSDRYQKLLGKGFMVADQIHYIEDYAKVIEKCETVSDTVSYMAFDGQGFFDYLGVKCYGTGFIPAARSYAAQEEIWNSNPSNLPVIFYIQPEFDYYIFRSMMDEGYIYRHEDHAFYPPWLCDLLMKNGYDMTPDDYRADCAPFDFGLSASSFGNSYNELIQAQTLSAQETELSSMTTIDGSKYDALYMEFSDEKVNAIPGVTFVGKENLVITVNWSNSDGLQYDCNQVTCRYGNGCILAPMGMNAGWSLSKINHFELTLSAFGSDEAFYSLSFDSGNIEESSSDILHIALKEINRVR